MTWLITVFFTCSSGAFNKIEFHNYEYSASTSEVSHLIIRLIDEMHCTTKRIVYVPEVKK